VVMEEFLVVMRRSRALGFQCFVDPLRSQAHAPRRLSGADKKQQPAEQQGGHGRSRNRAGTDGAGRFPAISMLFAANQHCQTLMSGILGQNP
jgi:hypothetical protein